VTRLAGGALSIERWRAIFALLADARERYHTFAISYPFYLTEHANPVSRRLHVIGTSLVDPCYRGGAGSVGTGAGPSAGAVIGYGFAWAAILVREEHSRPFRYRASASAATSGLFETVTGKRRW